MDPLPVCAFVILAIICGFPSQIAPSTTSTTQHPLQGYEIVGAGEAVSRSSNQMSVIDLQELDSSSYTPPGYKFDNFYMELWACAVDYRNKSVFLYDRDEKHLWIGTGLSSSPDQENMEFNITRKAMPEFLLKLAVDWISHNIYWTDPGANYIAMQPARLISDYSLYKVIVRDPAGGHHGLRGLTIDPNKGLLFYTSVYSQLIGRCDLTGENRKILKQGRTYISDDISADPETERLYWIYEMDIWTMDYNGNGHHLLRQFEVRFLSIEAALDKIMVTDFDDGIRVYSNEYGRPMEIAEYNTWRIDFYDIAIFHPQTQRMDNDGSACQVKGCQDICVALYPSFDAVCLCREGSDVDADGTSCIEAEGPFKGAIVFTDGVKICLLNILAISDFHQDFVDDMLCIYNRSASDQIRFIELNMADRMVYFATGTALYKMPLKETVDAERFVDVGTEIGGMSFDWIANQLYFTVTSRNEIGIVNMANGYVEYFTPTGTVEPGDIFVQPHHGTVLWTSKVNDSYSDINLADLSLGGEKTVQTLKGRPEGFSHDLTYDRIAFRLDDDIVVINYTGGNLFELKVYPSRNFTSFAIYQEYYLDMNRYNGRTGFYANVMGRYSGSATGTLENINTVVDVLVQNPDLQHSYASPCGFENGGCDHLCLRQGSSRTCQCSKGFTLQADEKSCVSELTFDDFMLVIDSSYDLIFQIPFDNTKPIAAVTVSDMGDVRGVMYNYLTEKVVWNSYTFDEMREVSLNGTGERKLLDTYSQLDVACNPEDMELDPSTGNIYYTCSSWYGSYGASHIGVLAPDGTHAFLNIDQSITSPTDLQIDPERGLLFWTDKSRLDKGVYRAYMNGSNSEQIVERADVEGPNGIALDRANQMIYFTDSNGMDSIYKCSYSCSEGITKIFDEVDHKFEDIGFSDGYLYFTAKNLLHITQLNPNNVSDLVRLRYEEVLGALTSLDLFRSSEPVNAHTGCSNNNGGCSHFCFPLPDGDHSCGCEDDYEFLPNSNKICENIPRCSLDIADATFNDDCLGLTETSCTYTCKENFRPKPGQAPSIMCYSNMTWENTDPCEAECEAGTEYQEGYDYRNCTECEIGFYKENISSSEACMPCMEGYSTKSEGSMYATDCNIENCQPGTFRPSGEENCTPCPWHHYQDGVDQRSCKPCPDGFVTDKEGSTACREKCIGSREFDYVQKTCVDCKAPYQYGFVDDEGCNYCPANQISSGDKPLSCQAAQQVRVVPNTTIRIGILYRVTSCTPSNKQDILLWIKVKIISRWLQIALCGFRIDCHSIIVEYGQNSCDVERKRREPGESFGVTVSLTAPEYFENEDGVAVATQRTLEKDMVVYPENYTAVTDDIVFDTVENVTTAVVCGPGEQRNSSTNQCIPVCPLDIANATFDDDCVGFIETSCTYTCKENFRPKPGQDTSIMCYSNMTWENTDPCEAECEAGTEYQEGYDYRNCTECEIGFYKENISSSDACMPCMEGYSTKSEGSMYATDCNIVNCQPGTFRPSGNESCTPCPLHHYQDGVDQRSCKACPDGLVTDTEGSTACRGKCIGGREFDYVRKTCVDCKAPNQYGFEDDEGCNYCPANQISSVDKALSCQAAQEERVVPYTTIRMGILYRVTRCTPSNKHDILVGIKLQIISRWLQIALRGFTIDCNTINVEYGHNNCDVERKRRAPQEPFGVTVSLSAPESFVNDEGVEVSTLQILEKDMMVNPESYTAGTGDTVFDTVESVTTAVVCGPGEQRNSNTNQCEACQAGWANAEVDSRCSQCPKGQYQDQPGSENCFTCPASKPVTEATGTDSLTGCVSECDLNEGICNYHGDCVFDGNTTKYICANNYQGDYCAVRLVSETNKDLIVGATIGGFIVLLIIFVIIVFVCRYFIRGKDLSKSSSSRDSSKYNKHRVTEPKQRFDNPVYDNAGSDVGSYSSRYTGLPVVAQTNYQMYLPTQSSTGRASSRHSRYEDDNVLIWRA